MGGIKIGRLLGFPIEVRYSFLFLLGFVLFAGLFNGNPVQSVLVLLVLFAAVLLHELGHAVVARRLGVQISGIDLNLFGGAAKMTSMPRSATDEVLIAAAGPAVSFALASLAGALYLLSGLSAFSWLLWVNLLLGAFNLLPALPMDGGRIFRALLSRRLGRRRATEISVKVAKGIALAMGIAGLIWGSIWFAALAVMLWLMSTAELNIVHLWDYASPEPRRPGASSGFWSRLRRSTAQEDSPAVEVLDRDGRPLHHSDDASRVREGGATFFVEEIWTGRERRWVVRDASGQVLMSSDFPL